MIKVIRFETKVEDCTRDEVFDRLDRELELRLNDIVSAGGQIITIRSSDRDCHSWGYHPNLRFNGSQQHTVIADVPNDSPYR